MVWSFTESRFRHRTYPWNFMSFLQNIIQKLTSLMKPLFGMCQVLEFYIKFKEHNKLKKPMVIDSLYILLSVSNFISQNADFWKKILHTVRKSLHILFLILSKFKQIIFCFPWNQKKTIGFLIILGDRN